MPIPIVTVKTDYPGPVYCPFTGIQLDGPSGPNLREAWFVDYGDAGLETEDAELRSVLDGLEDQTVEELAGCLDVPGAFILRVDRGWNGVDSYGFRPRARRMWGLDPEVVAVASLQLETIVEGMSGAFCPVCGKVVMDLAAQALRLCPHVISAVLDLAPETVEVHPAWAANPHGEPDTTRLDPARDVLLLSDEWVPVSISQYDHRACVTGSWTLRVAWPVAELDKEDPAGSVLQRVAAVEAQLTQAIETGSLDPASPGPEWTPEPTRGFGVSVHD